MRDVALSQFENTLVDQGYCLLESRKFGSARRIARRLIKMGSTLGYCLMARVFVGQQASDKAIQLLDAGQDLFPWSGEIQDLRRAITAEKGYECAIEGQELAALSIAKELQYMNSIHGYIIESRVHAGNGHTRKAIASLERGINEFPTAWLLLNELGTCQMENRQYEIAKASFEEALRYADDSAVSTIESSIVVCLFEQHHYEAALTLIDSIAEPSFVCKEIKEFINQKLKLMNDHRSSNLIEL